MDLFTFNPPNRSINIDGGPHELGPFSIKIMTLVQRRFGSVERFQQIIDKKNEDNGIFKGDFPESINWLCFALLTSNEHFESPCELWPKFRKQKEDVYRENVNIVLAVIEDAQPVINFKDLPKGGKVDNSDIDLFSRSYASIAREIDHTIDQFYNLTLRQINQIQDDLNFVKNQEHEFQADIHGVKLQKPRDNRPNSQISFSKNENKTIDDHAKMRMEQIKNERSHFSTQ